MWYAHFPQKWAMQINHFYATCFNDDLNYYRPGAYTSEFTDNRGENQEEIFIRRLQDTLLDFETSSQWRAIIKEGFLFKEIDDIVLRYTPNQYVKMMRIAKAKLFRRTLTSNLKEFKP